MQLAPLPVVIPLLVAAVLAGVGNFVHRRALDLTALATSAVVTIVSALLAIDSAKAPIVYWFGGWQPDPHSHFPVGISFMIDPFGAGLASLVSLLTLAAFTFSWSYFESVKALYHILMLVFLGAMCGLCLTGDLFNLFVWFELMTAAAVALCGYKSEESQPLQGALNFAVTNTAGAFLSLTGVALIYALTGSLNMAEVGRTIAQNRPGAHFLSVAFLFVIAGFLVKGAIFPFHFWLADAHAVAPTPVCMLFSGVMVELGLYAIARIYWLVFAGGSIAPESVRATFLTLGTVTAVVGALYCFGQRHLKRLLAFSTISHVGLMLIGFALLDYRALEGTALYLLGHGFIKASLFIGAGILLHRFGSVDEYDIRNAPRSVAPIGVMMVIGAWGLAGLPPFATYFGEDRIEQISSGQHLRWLPAILMFAETLTAAAVLRFSGRVFFHLGRGRSVTSRGAPHIHMEVETGGEHPRVPAFMWIPMGALLVAAAVIMFPLRGHAEHYAREFEMPAFYESAVLQNGASQADGLSITPAGSPGSSPSQWWPRLFVAIGVVLISAATLFSKPVQKMPRPLRQIPHLVIKLRTFHSGRIGDYVAWFAFGIAACGVMLLLFH